MMGENKNMVFERWLAAYGSHLEELAGANLSGPGRNEVPSHDVPDPQNAPGQKH